MWEPALRRFSISSLIVMVFDLNDIINDQSLPVLLLNKVPVSG
jgi:hypothetical protein